MSSFSAINMTRTRLQTSNIAGERLNWNSHVERNLDYHKKKGLKWIRSEMLPFNGRCCKYRCSQSLVSFNRKIEIGRYPLPFSLINFFIKVKAYFILIMLPCHTQCIYFYTKIWLNNIHSYTLLSILMFINQLKRIT
jgi:hypothetical protein